MAEYMRRTEKVRFNGEANIWGEVTANARLLLKRTHWKLRKYVWNDGEKIQGNVGGNADGNAWCNRRRKPG